MVIKQVGCFSALNLFSTRGSTNGVWNARRLGHISGTDDTNCPQKTTGKEASDCRKCFLADWPLKIQKREKFYSEGLILSVQRHAKRVFCGVKGTQHKETRQANCSANLLQQSEEKILGFNSDATQTLPANNPRISGGVGYMLSYKCCTQSEPSLIFQTVGTQYGGLSRLKMSQFAA